MTRPRTILIAGGTGYVGGRLVPRLLQAGHRVRVLSRSPGRARRAEWSDEVELVAGDVLDRDSLDRALEGCDAAYYLVHSMGSTPRSRSRSASASDPPRASVTCGV